MYDENGDLCFERPNEDLLALLTWPAELPAPIMAEQANYMVEQNQQLQNELGQALLAHRNDAERAQEATKQRDMQFQSDFRVMQTEFARRQTERQETSCVEWEKYEASACAEQQKTDEQRQTADAKWEELVQQLREDYVKRQKEMDEEHVHRDAELKE